MSQLEQKTKNKIYSIIHRRVASETERENIFKDLDKLFEYAIIRDKINDSI